MSPTTRSLLTATLVAALAVAASLEPRPAAAAERSDHADHRHQLVRIFEGRVRPDVQRIQSDDALGWLNYTSRIARVSFDAEVAKKLTCTSPGSFHVDGDRLVSGDIQATQFVTLCNLAPGEYEYQVTLRSGIGTTQSAEKVIVGRIVVAPPAAGAR
jgi:hypothetical protein